MGSEIDPNHWKRPRPPFQRLCSFNWTSSGADWGGVWMLTSCFDMDTPKETWELTRVMSAKIDGVTGDTTKIWRATYESGGLRVWRADLIDPVYKFKGEVVSQDVAGMYRAAERALVKMRKSVAAVFTAEVRAALSEDNDYKASALIDECPCAELRLGLVALLHEYRLKKHRRTTKKKG